MNSQEAFARVSTSTESQMAVNLALLLEHQNKHQSVNYHDVPTSDLISQNGCDIGLPIMPIPESEVFKL